jgi:ATP-binding cassette, subfamily B, bacterial MsbA
MSTNNILFQFAKPYPGRIIVTFLLGFSGALFNGVGTTLIVPVILAIVGQNLNTGDAPGIIKAIISPFDQVPEHYRIAVMALAVILTIAIKNLASYASTLASSSLSRIITTDMREAALKVLLEVDLDYYAKTRIGDLINSLGGEIARAASTINTAIRLFSIVITILVFVGLLVLMSWQLTIAATVLLSLVTLVNQYAIARSKDYGKMLSEMSKAYSITVLEVMNGMRLVRSTANEDREYQKITKLIRDREQADFKSQANSEAIVPVSEVMGITALVMIVLLSKYLFGNQVASLSQVILIYLFTLLRLLPYISQLNTIRSSFANASTSISVAWEFLRRENKPFMTSGKNTYNTLTKGIHFHNISFAYPGYEKLVLKEVDLFLPKGTTLALVGSSGAGKSTMADLLPRFYDPISGSIMLDDVDLRDFNVQSVRQSMGIVSQDTFLFNDSVRYNIAYGKPGASDEEVIAASKRANAHEFITKLPQGFDTLIGDRGVMLSGGQRQRLAIARALLQDPEILILDEATSALDTVSERLVQQAIDDLSQDRTTLVIAHRLSTVQKAHQIAVLDQGRVVEVGTHQELLGKNGYYTRLYSMQFSGESGQIPEGKLQSNQVAENLLRIPHELRTRLNPTIGFLRLLLDDLVDNPQERQELMEESYKATMRVSNIIDVFEDMVKLQTRFKTNSDNENLNRIAEKFTAQMTPMHYSLRSLVDHMGENTPEQNELIKEAFHCAIHLLDTTQELEDAVKLPTAPNEVASLNGKTLQSHI